MWWAPKKRIEAASAAAGYGLANVVLRQFKTGNCALLLLFSLLVGAAWLGWEESWFIEGLLSLSWQMSHLGV